jgi:DNA-binding CsgD family transcriptional regulator
MTKPIDEPMYPRRSLADRRRDVIKLLTEQPEISNRRVAYIAGVSRELVNAIRSNMIRLSKIESRHALRRVGADGKTYRITRRPRTQDAQP